MMDKAGRKHKVFYRACVSPTRCPPLLSSKNVDKLVVTPAEAYVETQGRQCPLVPIGKSGLWALPVRP